MWDVTTGQAVPMLYRHKNWVTSVQLSPDRKSNATASNDGTARMWNAAKEEPQAVLSGHEAIVWRAQFSPDGKRIVTVSSDGCSSRTVSCWTPQKGVQQIDQAGEDKTPRVWNVTTGIEVAVLRGHARGVWRAQFSPDGKQIVTAREDKTARVWDVVTGQEMAVPCGHEDIVWSA